MSRRRKGGRDRSRSERPHQHIPQLARYERNPSRSRSYQRQHSTNADTKRSLENQYSPPSRRVDHRQQELLRQGNYDDAVGTPRDKCLRAHDASVTEQSEQAGLRQVSSKEHDLSARASARALAKDASTSETECQSARASFPPTPLENPLKRKVCDTRQVVRDDHKRRRVGLSGVRHEHLELVDLPKDQQTPERAIVCNTITALAFNIEAQHIDYQSIAKLPRPVRDKFLGNCKVVAEVVKATKLDEELEAGMHPEIGAGRLGQIGDVLYVAVVEANHDKSIGTDRPSRITASGGQRFISKTRPCVVYSRERSVVKVWVGRSYNDAGEPPARLDGKTCRLWDIDGKQPKPRTSDLVAFSSGMTGITLSKITFLEFGELHTVDLEHDTYSFAGRLEPEGFQKLVELRDRKEDRDFSKAGREVQRARDGLRRQ